MKAAEDVLTQCIRRWNTSGAALWLRRRGHRRCKSKRAPTAETILLLNNTAPEDLLTHTPSRLPRRQAHTHTHPSSSVRSSSTPLRRHKINLSELLPKRVWNLYGSVKDGSVLH